MAQTTHSLLSLIPIYTRPLIPENLLAPSQKQRVSQSFALKPSMVFSHRHPTCRLRHGHLHFSVYTRRAARKLGALPPGDSRHRTVTPKGCKVPAPAKDGRRSRRERGVIGGIGDGEGCFAAGLRNVPSDSTGTMAVPAVDFLCLAHLLALGRGGEKSKV